MFSFVLIIWLHWLEIVILQSQAPPRTFLQREAWFHSLVAKPTSSLTWFVLDSCGIFSVVPSCGFSDFSTTEKNVYQQHGKEKTLREGFIL